MTQVDVVTNHGTITLEIDGDKAPKTAANFLGYVDDQFYDGTIFHRVIPGFMAQGGGYDGSMKRKDTKAPVDNEADNGLLNDLGTVAMARTSDPHSATAQFFINVKDNAFLNHTARNDRGWGYCVFGRVVEGMDVVRAIEGVQTGSKQGMKDVPLEPVVIQSVRRTG